MTSKAVTDPASSPELPEAAPRRGSPVARAALLAYFLLIVYASWYPFTGWRNNGLPVFSFLNLVKQRYWTGFDVMVNIVGYVPFGGQQRGPDAAQEGVHG